MPDSITQPAVQTPPAQPAAIGAAEQGTAGGQPLQTPPIDDSHIKELIGQETSKIYGNFQKQVGTIQQELEKEKKARTTAESKLAKIENADDIIGKADEARSYLLQAEVTRVRNQLIEKEFPLLKGREQYIQGYTLDEMRSSANQVIRDFGIAGSQQATSIKGAIDQTPSSNLTGLASLSEEERKKVISQMSNEDLSRLTGMPPITPKK